MDGEVCRREMARRGARRFALVVAFVVGVAVFLLPVSGAEQRAPEGYWAFEERTLVRDVVTYGAARTGTHNLRVAWMGPDAGVRVTAGLAFERLTASETTSSMCRRLNCLLAVNGDFFDTRTKQPIGGMVVDSTLVRSPTSPHPQLVITEDGRWSAESVGWTGRLDPVPPEEEEEEDRSLLPLPGGEDENPEDDRGHDPGEPVGVVGLNTPAAPDAVVAYTTRYNDTTLTGPEWTELTVRLGEPIRPDASQVVELVHLSTEGGNSPIPPDGAVFAGHGAGAEELERLWRDAKSGAVREIRFVSDTSVDEIVTSIGGGPMVMREGRYVAGEGGLARTRHPRTLVGWNDRGERWLVTVDGRQPRHSQGMTLGEAADFLRGLGATEALNLDGGGSTTFVRQGEVVNRPIHVGHAGRERPVANAVVAVATAPLVPPPAPEPTPEPVETQSPQPPASEAPAAAPPSIAPEPEPTASAAPEPTPVARSLAGPPGASYSVPEEATHDRKPLVAGATGLLIAAGVAVSTRSRGRVRR